MALRIYIVEDSAAIRENLIATLCELAFVQVAGTSGTEQEGTQWLRDNPDGWELAIVDRDWRKVLAHTDLAVVMEKGQIVLASPSADLVAQPAALEQVLGV